MRTLTVVAALAFATFSASGDQYSLASRYAIEHRNGQCLTLVNQATLNHTNAADRDDFSLTLSSTRVWLSPRTKESEAKAKEAGCPVDGTPFVPPRNPPLSFSFREGEDAEISTLDQATASDQSTIDWVDLLFFDGQRAAVKTEIVAVMERQHAKPFEFTIDGRTVTLYVYWYDRHKRRKSPEVATYMVVVQEEAKRMVACRAVFRQFTTTTKEAGEYDLIAQDTQVDLDALVTALNARLDEGFVLRISKWDDQGTSVFATPAP